MKTFATRIEAAQGPEITQMTAWLTTWGQPVTAKGSMSGIDMGSSGPMGMMTPAQMKELKAATGKDFDRMFLIKMTTHHKGAIAMATTEQADGSNAAAITLAKSIQTSQTSEVTQMSQLLKPLRARIGPGPASFGVRLSAVSVVVRMLAMGGRLVCGAGS